MPGPDLLQPYSNIEKANTEENSCLRSVILIQLCSHLWERNPREAPDIYQAINILGHHYSYICGGKEAYIKHLVYSIYTFVFYFCN